MFTDVQGVHMNSVHGTNFSYINILYGGVPWTTAIKTTLNIIFFYFLHIHEHWTLENT